MTLKTHYDTLKVTQDAPPEVISAAYKALAHIYHPDKNASTEAVLIMQGINISYKILSDPQKRAEHDLWIRSQERRSERDTSGKRSAPNAAGGEKAKKASGEAAKWKAWADKTVQEAKEAKQRADKAVADLSKAKPEDRAKWETWVTKTAQEAREAQERADKASAQSAKAEEDAHEAAAQVQSQKTEK